MGELKRPLHLLSRENDSTVNRLCIDLVIQVNSSKHIVCYFGKFFQYTVEYDLKGKMWISNSHNFDISGFKGPIYPFLLLLVLAFKVVSSFINYFDEVSCQVRDLK